MKTFKLSISADIKAIVTDEWVSLIREVAQDPQRTSPFLTKAQAMHPTDDDEFILMVLTNGVRLNVRDNLLELFAASGLGCTISPVAAHNREIPAYAKPVLASEVQTSIPQ